VSAADKVSMNIGMPENVLLWSDDAADPKSDHSEATSFDGFPQSAGLDSAKGSVSSNGNSGYPSTMHRRPIVFAKAMLGGGLVLLVIVFTAIALQGFSDWALLIAPFAITVNGVVWMRRVHKYGSIFPTR
jgi:hypothetical protein